jgi:hypothetical protein
MQSDKHFDKPDILVSLICATTSSCLLAGYILPNTIFQRLSILSFINFQQLASRSLFPPICGLIVVSAACSFILSQLSGKSSFLWLLTSSLGALYAAQSILLAHSDFEASADCLAAAIAFSVGIFCAAICGRPSVLARVMSFLGMVQSLYAIGYYALSTNMLVSGDVYRAGGSFIRPNFLYPIMIFCLPLAVSEAIRADRKTQRILWCFCGTAMFAALIFTWYRGGLLGIAVGGGWMAFRLIASKRAAIFVTLGLCLVFGASLVVRTNGPLNSQSSNRSLIGRDRLWQAGWSQFLQQPVGVGLAKLRLHVISGRGDKAEYRQPQNIELYFMDELGVFGAGLFLLFAISITLTVRQNYTPTGAGIGAAWIALLVAGQTDTPFGVTDRISSIALLGALLGMTLLLNASGKPTQLGTSE